MSVQIQDNPFSQSRFFQDKKIHLGISGSIACYKAADLVRAWRKMGISVSATLSKGAEQFISPLLVKALGADPVYSQMFAGNPFDHLEPGQKADCMVIAPASADMIAKLANGFADEMLCAQFAAYGEACVIAPAMNPAMWRHPALQANIHRLTAFGCEIVEPGVGDTACGDSGKGRLADLPDIFLMGLEALSPSDYSGFKLMVTLGPTREPWDGARFWSNPSSGKMGMALATAAWLRGAEVTAICGPCPNLCLPSGITQIHVGTAREMHDAARYVWPTMDMGVFTAAVSDFAPCRPAGGDRLKFKKDSLSGELTVKFTRNPDILASLSKTGKQKTLGFAAEITGDMQGLLPLARGKLKAKQSDMIAANRINHGDGAFGSDLSELAVVDRNGREEILMPQTKADLAWLLLTWLLNL